MVVLLAIWSHSELGIYFLKCDRFGDHALERVGTHYYGTKPQERGAAEAEQLVPEELGKLGCKETKLMPQRKGDPWIVLIARQLQDETTMTQKWIAQQLQMGG